LALICLSACPGLAQPPRGESGERPRPAGGLKLQWQPLRIVRSHFPPNIGMLDAERDDYAGNLAGVAVTGILEGKAAEASLEQARRMLALALHLSPRNKKAVVINGQLAKGIVPKPPDSDFRPQTMARLLMKRAELLTKQAGKSNLELAGYMLDLAVGLDPDNEDAIYLSEVHRLDHGDVDWRLLTSPQDRE